MIQILGLCLMLTALVTAPILFLEFWRAWAMVPCPQCHGKGHYIKQDRFRLCHQCWWGKVDRWSPQAPQKKRGEL